MGVRIYANPGAEGRVGIGVEGEIFEAEDAWRLIGMGIATRTRPGSRRKRRKAAKPVAQAVPVTVEDR